jgi:hypothetical protein
MSDAGRADHALNLFGRGDSGTSAIPRKDGAASARRTQDQPDAASDAADRVLTNGGGRRDLCDH